MLRLSGETKLHGLSLGMCALAGIGFICIKMFWYKCSVETAQLRGFFQVGQNLGEFLRARSQFRQQLGDERESVGESFFR
jgi:hypothetical protein